MAVHSVAAGSTPCPALPCMLPALPRPVGGRAEAHLLKLDSVLGADADPREGLSQRAVPTPCTRHSRAGHQRCESGLRGWWRRPVGRQRQSAAAHSSSSSSSRKQPLAAAAFSSGIQLQQSHPAPGSPPGALQLTSVGEGGAHDLTHGGVVGQRQPVVVPQVSQVKHEVHSLEGGGPVEGEDDELLLVAPGLRAGGGGVEEKVSEFLPSKRRCMSSFL